MHTLSRSCCVALVVLCAAAWSSVVASAAEDAAPGYAPGALVIVKFGGTSIGEVIEKTSPGFYKVKTARNLGGDRTSVYAADMLKPAEPGAKFGDRPIKKAEPADPADASGLAPGTLVIVDYGGKSVGEVIEKTGSGRYRVRLKTSFGSEGKSSFSLEQIVVAKPGLKFGDRIDRNTGDIPKPVTEPAAMPAGSQPGAIDKAEVAGARKANADLRAEMLKGGLTGSAKPGTLVILKFEQTVGRVIAEVSPKSYRVRFLGADAGETEAMFQASRLRLAEPGQTYGLNLRTGKVVAADATTTAANAAQDRKKERLAAAAAAPAVMTLPAATPEGTLEAQKLVGSWRIVETSRQGRKSTPRGPEKVVITATTIQFPGASGTSLGNTAAFRVDPTKSPKQFDFQLQLDKADEVRTGIYELQGNTLRLCMAELDLATRRPGPRPIEFATSSGIPEELMVLERLQDLAAMPLKTAAEVDGTLLEALDQWIAQLEASKHQEFLDSAIKPRGTYRTKAADLPAERYPALLATFRAVRRMTPTMSAGNTQAVYDLSNVHIEGAQAFPKLNLAKHEGRWVIAEN